MRVLHDMRQSVPVSCSSSLMKEESLKSAEISARPADYV